MNATKTRNAKNFIGILFAIIASQGTVSMLATSFLNFVYTEYLGMVAATVSIILGIGVVFDGVSDFLMGAVMDRVRTKYGKARHWFLWMAVPVFVCSILMFACPANAGNMLKIVYLFVIYNLFCTAITAIRLPANTLPALVEDDSVVRGKASIFIALGCTAANLLVTMTADPITKAFGGGLHGYRMYMFIFAALTLILCLGAFWLLREVRTYGKDDSASADGRPEKKKHKNILVQAAYLFKNKFWLCQQGMSIAYGFMNGLGVGAMAYFCVYVLGGMDKLGMYSMISMGSMLVGSFLAFALVRRVDGINISRAGAVIALVGYAGALLTVRAHQAPYYVFLAITGISNGLILSQDTALTARVIDYGEWKNGIRQEGLAFSGKAVIHKIAQAVGGALVGIMLTASGYVGGAGAVGDSVVSGLIMIAIGIPAICSVVYAVCAFLFRLPQKRIEEIQAELYERRGDTPEII